MVQINNNNKHKLKLLRFWLNNGLKPFVRIEPKIKHLNIKYFETKELLKAFQDDNLNLINNDLSINEILALELSLQDKLEFLKLHHKGFIDKLKTL